MNRVIYKYPMKPHSMPELPVGAQILSVAVQKGEPYIWALIDPEAATEIRSFRVFATGETFDPTGLTYIGTFHGIEGWMVFHLFEASREVLP